MSFYFNPSQGEKGTYYLPPYGSAKVAVSRFSTIRSPPRSRSPHQNRVIFGGMAVQDYFSIVEDPPYVERHYKHKLSDILIIALASYLCGGDVLSYARLGQDLYSGYTLSYYTACSGYPL